MPVCFLNSVKPVHDPLVEIVPAEVRVPVRRFNLEDAVSELQNRYVEGSAAKVVYRDLLVCLLLVQSIGKRRGRRLVYNALDMESGNLPGVLGGLPLRVIEISRHGDDRLGDRFAEEVLRCLLHFLQNPRRDLLRGEFAGQGLNLKPSLAVVDHIVGHHFHFVLNLREIAPHKPLGGADRVFGVGDDLVFGHLAHQPFPLVGKRDDRGGCPLALGVLYHHRFAAHHRRYAGICSSQIDSYYLSHCHAPL